MEQNKKIEVPIKVLENICRYCEKMAIYDKLSAYDDFYYKLKLILNQNHQ